MSDEYHKINAPYKRDKKGVMLHGDWCMPELAYLAENEWEFTEKVDGTNIRLYLHRKSVDNGLDWEIRGRTDNAQIPKPLLQAINDNVLSADTIKSVRKIMDERDIDDLIVYGEGYGPRINGGGKYGDAPRFVAFDIRVGDFWLLRKDVDDFCEKVGLDSVPVIFTGNLWRGFGMVENGRTYDIAGNDVDRVWNGPGMKSAWGDFEAEGLIAVPKVPLFTRSGNRVITKIKHVDFRR